MAPCSFCSYTQFKGGITAKVLKIWAPIEGRSHRRASNALNGHYSSQKEKKNASAKRLLLL